MPSTEIDQWRAILSGDEIRSVIEYIQTLAPRPISERALKTREKFRTLSPAIMRLALESALCREDLREKLSWSAEGFFLQSRVEQSTRPEIAQHHGKNFSQMHVLEIGCGIGFDSAALCRHATTLTTLDTDACCCAIAEHNLRLQGYSNFTIFHGDLNQYIDTHTLSGIDALWADPGRRSESGERIYDPELYHPPLSSITEIDFPGIIGIKVSPALNITTLPEAWCREFIGWAWTCPEQILWKNLDRPKKFATLVDQQLDWFRTHDERCSARAELLAVDNFLIEPHPALVRTGDLEHFYFEHQLSQIDGQLALGLSPVAAPLSPWYREFRIVENFRFKLKTLRERLNILGWDSRTQIKKRGVQEDPDQIHRALKLPAPKSDSPWGFVILIKIDNTPQVILAHRT